MKRILMTMCLIGVLSLSNGFAEEIRVITHDLSPYSYVENEEITGLAVEIVKTMMKETGIQSKIEMFPWARAWEITKREPNVLVFVLTRATERDPYVKWVGDVVPYMVSLWKLKSRSDIQVNSLEDAKKYTIGGVIKFKSSKILASKGIEVELVPNNRMNLRKLFAGRIDLVHYDDYSLVYEAKKEKLDASQLEKVHTFRKTVFNVAFSRKTPDTIVEKFKKSLIKMKEDGTHKMLLEKYLK